MSALDGVFVGIDWAVDSDQVCILGASGEVMEETSFEHSPGGLAQLVERLLKAGGGLADTVSVAIEVPHGPIVELLIERGFRVFSINPKQLDRFRDRFSLPGAKDDRLDALVLADSLRTDARHFRELEPEEPLVIEIREISRIHEDLQKEKVQLLNRLREQLRRYYPQFLEAAPALDRAWVLATLACLPTPAHAQSVRPSKVRALLKKHRSRADAAQLLEILRQPGFDVAEGTVQAASTHVRMVVMRLELVLLQLKACQRRLDELVAEFTRGAEASASSEADSGQECEQHDVEILRSLPGVGRIVLAVLLAEAWRLLRERNYHGLRAHSGVAPVTRRSGRKIVVIQRTSCNPRLRNAVYHWARVASQRDPAWSQRYANLRAKGHSHARALRTLGDRLLKVACTMLEQCSTYDSSKLRRVA